MLSQFTNFIQQQALFEKKDRVLLAISGGVDSVVMCDLFAKAGYDFGIAHCNFSLRSNESDGDELFVKVLAEKYKVPFFTTRFNTTEYASEKGISKQMAARDLRYNWFEEIRTKNDYQYIAVAHHKTDNVETILINMLRGTGIAGLHGILPKNEKLVRPLLFATRDEVESYAGKENSTFRNDSSNDSDKYIRNKLRHQVLPVLREINNNIENTFLQNAHRIKGAEEIYNKAIEGIKNDISIKSEHILEIDIEKLKLQSSLPTLLFELLNPYGFNDLQIKNIITSLSGTSGKQFTSADFKLVKERNSLVINPLKSKDKNLDYLITEKQNILETKAFNLNILQNQYNTSFKIPIQKNIACFDAELLKFPLHLRRYKQGDYFYPLGMNGKKLLSDFFIDNKLSQSQKENTWVLTSDDEIIWILKKRIDNRFKLNEQTKRVCSIEIIDLQLH
jgi:tRNA(Ile)-lysidine synthase